MAHRQQRDFCAQIRARFPLSFRDKCVLDVGSMDVNGNNRYLFAGGHYTGCDMARGKNVDIVGGVRDVTGSFDFIISTEMLEHSPTWADDLVAMGERLPRGGALLLTCAGPGRAEHGTRRCPHADMQSTSDYYRNISVSEMLGVLAYLPWDHIECRAEHTSHDTYLFGIRA